MKFRKKPVVVDAFRYGVDAFPVWAEEAVTDGKMVVPQAPEGPCEIQSWEGTMRAMPGDYIIRGVMGELYPCSPEIFVMTYEQVMK